MKSEVLLQGLLASLLLAFAVAGCSKEIASAPKPLAVEQAPASLEEAFKEAAPTKSRASQDAQVKALVNDATAALRGQDYAKALFALQSLSGRSDLTDAQRQFVTRAMLSVHQILEERANTGDQNAQDALELRSRTK